MKKYIKPYKLWTGAFIPNWLLQRTEIGPGVKACYARLCQYAGKNGICYPKQTTLAAELGVKERQVRNYLTQLVKYRLIEMFRWGKKCSNRYKFLYHEWMDIETRNYRQELTDNRNSNRHNNTGVVGKKLPIHRKRIIKKNESNDSSSATHNNKKIPTKEMLAVFLKYWHEHNEGTYMFRQGKDGKIAKQLYQQCLKDSPDNPLTLFAEKVEVIFTQFDVKEFGGISFFWNMASASKCKKEGEFIPLGGKRK